MKGPSTDTDEDPSKLFRDPSRDPFKNPSETLLGSGGSVAGNESLDPRALGADSLFRHLLRLSCGLPFVRIHSGNNSKIIFLCICICYETKNNSETISICYAAPSKRQRTAVSASATQNEFQNNICLYLYLL